MAENEKTENHEHTHPNYLLIWIVLMALMLGQFGVKKLIPLNYSVFVGFIFVVATIKTFLVALNFMHLKFEKLVIYLLAISPVFFLIVFFSVIAFDVPV